MKYCIIILLACIDLSSAKASYTTAEIQQLGYPASIHWIDISDIEEKLKGKPPMNVGFDVDDALIFSSAIASRVLADNPGKNLSEITDFHSKMNCDYVKFSMPKAVGRQLVAFHQKRGDNLYFITARAESPCIKKQYSINDYIKETFDIKNMRPVIFTNTDFGGGSKADWLKKKKIAIYYGDSDSDIKAANDANAYGVRIMRAANSLKKSENNIGIYGEPVVKGSDI